MFCQEHQRRRAHDTVVRRKRKASVEGGDLFNEKAVSRIVCREGKRFTDLNKLTLSEKRKLKV